MCDRNLLNVANGMQEDQSFALVTYHAASTELLYGSEKIYSQFTKGLLWPYDEQKTMRSPNACHKHYEATDWIG